MIDQREFRDKCNRIEEIVDSQQDRFGYHYADQKLERNSITFTLFVPRGEPAPHDVVKRVETFVKGEPELVRDEGADKTGEQAYKLKINQVVEPKRQ